jgi:integrase
MKAPRACWWTIPAADSKNGRSHRVFLTPEALGIVEAQEPDPKKRGEYVFAGRGGAIPIDRIKKAGAACAKALGTDIRSHDLRRTAATRMAAAGVPSAHVSQVLNHTPAGAAATRHYDLHNYDHEKQIALETWARELTGILDGATPAPASIVPISRRA